MNIDARRGARGVGPSLWHRLRTNVFASRRVLRNTRVTIREIRFLLGCPSNTARRRTTTGINGDTRERHRYYDDSSTAWTLVTDTPNDDPPCGGEVYTNYISSCSFPAALLHESVRFPRPRRSLRVRRRVLQQAIRIL